MTEYRTDKRTKNLTLRDIHVGDWVQVWSEQTERYSPPLKITQICDDGTVYLIIDEENRLDPWEENIKDIDALPITPELLRGFGFNIKDVDDDIIAIGIIKYKGKSISSLCKDFDLIDGVIKHNGKYSAGVITDLNDFLQYCEKTFGIKVEWKGVEK